MARVPMLVNEGLQIAFRRHGDRYGHTIDVREGDRAIPALASREGDGGHVWPDSPPLQQLALDSQGETQRALLMGMAGSSHWSVSIELGPGTAAVVFDVACRVKQEPPSVLKDDIRSGVLGSAYQAVADIIEQSDNAMLLSVKSRRLLIESLPAPSASDAAALVASGDEFWLGSVVDPGPLPRTLRWRYRIGLV